MFHDSYAKLGLLFGEFLRRYGMAIAYNLFDTVSTLRRHIECRLSHNNKAQESSRHKD